MTPETQLFGVFNHVPFGIVLSLIALLLIASFITSADSSNICIRNEITFGSLNPSSMVKVVWGISQALIAFVVLLAGGGNGAEALNAIRKCWNYKCIPILLCRHTHDEVSTRMRTRNVL